MTRVAAVDCGTNSIRLLICEIDGEDVNELHRTMEIVRLGKGVDAAGELDPAAIARTRAALTRFVEIMEFEEVSDVRMVATSATRDASNREDFFSMTAELLGRIRPGVVAEVISGEEEAMLSFRGAVADLDPELGPFCVIDLGGGSTEFIVGNSEGTILGSHSTQLGCVRVTERIMRSDPPTATEIEIAEDFIREQLSRVEIIVPIADARVFVGCAGTFTTLSALAQGLEIYDPAAIHGSALRFDALKVLTKEVVAESATQRAEHPVIHKGRADVLGSGATIVRGIVEMIERNTAAEGFIISEKDILDGIVAGLADKLQGADTAELTQD
ncbi:Ppx/GppA phosphatase family protein [Corynebacterium sp. A21]|uniref:Ppx/GppA phosphatase family protein n=1 Tax=Corynebacterium sp. A21 TaxID=3457318 RepID=UPI003FD238A6